MFVVIAFFCLSVCVLRRQDALHVSGFSALPSSLQHVDVSRKFRWTSHSAASWPIPQRNYHRCDDDARRRRTSSRLSLASSSSTSPFASVPCNDGTLIVQRAIASEKNGGTGNRDDDDNGTQEFNIAYKIFRPMALSSRQAAPVIVLHGGPSVPSNYLWPLVHAIPYRSIVVYDQLGCGESDEPSSSSSSQENGAQQHDNTNDYYSINLAVQDLKALIKKLGIRRYHLYGQSFGGILAYEFLKRMADDDDANSDDIDDDEGCLSVVLSSTPSNVKVVEQEAQRLIDELNMGGNDADNSNSNGNNDDNGNGNVDIAEAFRRAHQCRTEEMPQPLADAYAKAGTTWRGTAAISDYVAEATPNAAKLPSCMMMRGEHDFVTKLCTEDWKTMFPKRRLREKVLKDCSHHGLLENPLMYGDLLESFFAEYD